MKTAGRELNRFAKGRAFYGWYIALAGAASNFLVIGIVIQGLGLFIEPIRQELGWSARAIGLGLSLRSLESGTLAPFTGYLIDRLGPRKMAVTGGIITASGLFMFSQVHTLWLYYLASVVMAFGQSLGTSGAFTLAVMNWFRRKRGLATGVMNTGNGLSYLMVAIMAGLMGAFGWRHTLMISAGVVAFITVPLAFVIRSRPEPYGYLPDGDPQTETQGVQAHKQQASGMSVNEALRTPAFWLLVVASTVLSAGHGALLAFQIPALLNKGFSLSATALMFAMYGLVQLAIRMPVGFLGDKWGHRRFYTASFILMAGGRLIFVFLTPVTVWLLPIYWLVYGIGQAAFAIMGQTIIAEYFGTKRFATLRGLNHGLHLPATVAGPFLAGWIFDATGSYDPAFLISSIATGASVVFMLMIRRPTWRDVEQAQAARVPAP